MKKTMSPAMKAGDFDGSLRASSSRYEDFDPRGGFNARVAMTESDWTEYRKAYESAYSCTLIQYGRAK